MKKIIELLNNVKAAMVLVKEYEKPIDMHCYTQDTGIFDESKDIESCGTPCCVAGWAALYMGVGQEWVDEELFDLLRVNRKPMNYRDVIFDNHSSSRLRVASILNLRTDFNHLTLENPSPDDVIEFTDYLIEHFEDNEL